MNDDHDDQPGNTRIPKPGSGTGSIDPEHRREPLFSGFDEDDEPFEEPDRDTDSAYHEHDEEPFDDLFEDEGAPDDDLQ